MVLVTNKMAKTLSIKTKDGVTHYIRPKVVCCKVNIDEGDIVSKSPNLIIKAERSL